MDTLGQKIKKLRIENKITLKELGEKTSLSVGFLSQLERGLSTIAIDSLEKIASIFNKEISYFFQKLEETGSVVLRSYNQKTEKIIEDRFIFKNLSANLKDKVMRPRLVQIQPMKKSEEIKTYGHEGEEFIFILEGILTLNLEKEKFNLYPGDSAHYNSEISHNWSNETNNIVKFLVTSTPNPFNEKK
ncbi:XRE family transcriptional regulator [uncultured Cetobacterium sp.]|uniref:helix-turn-helix domain-containing protein n=2 Tax=uncultured Cetobacterium sp. TaxID=527638 RepID=UPI00262EE578|nr:XRE family transcriptional regulator [uncultured Cetobacterium sp.]